MEQLARMLSSCTRCRYAFPPGSCGLVAPLCPTAGLPLLAAKLLDTETHGVQNTSIGRCSKIVTRTLQPNAS
jgi:hypothetical protein